MPNVVFVAPFLRETTLRFVAAAADLPDVRVGLVTQDPPERVPEGVRGRLAAVARVDDALDPQRIADGVRTLAGRLGSVDRLLGALEELQVPLGEVREALRIPGMAGTTARNFRDKARMKDVLHAAGVPCARHRRVASPEEVRAFVAETGLPVILKPTAGSGSRGTYRIDAPARLDEVLGFDPPSAGRETMVEEFVTGEEHSFDSVFVGGSLVWWSVSDYHPTPLEVLENPWIQWCVVLPRALDRPEHAAIRGEAERGLKALGLVHGLSHMEWFHRPDGSVAISEVGARPPGAQFTTLLSWAHDVDLYRAWARLMVFDAFDPPPRPYAAGAAFLRGQGTGRIRAIHGVEETRRAVGDVTVEVRLPQVGAPPAGSYDGDGWIIVRHPETDVVREALARVVRTIRVEVA